MSTGIAIASHRAATYSTSAIYLIYSLLLKQFFLEQIWLLVVVFSSYRDQLGEALHFLDFTTRIWMIVTLKVKRRIYNSQK